MLRQAVVGVRPWGERSGLLGSPQEEGATLPGEHVGGSWRREMCVGFGSANWNFPGRQGWGGAQVEKDI